MAGMDLPVRAIREQVASALDLVVHQERLRDGTRKIVKVTEVQRHGRRHDHMSDIFEFEQTGVEGGKIVGRIRPTGIRPKFTDRIEAAGIYLPPSVFGLANTKLLGGSGLTCLPPSLYIESSGHGVKHVSPLIIIGVAGSCR